MADSHDLTDTEKLAAFLDGRLDAPARGAVIADLAGSEEKRELFADAVAALPAERSVGAGARSRRRWRRMVPWGAALAASLAAIVLWPRARATEDGSNPARFVMERAPLLPMLQPVWEPTRGASGGPGTGQIAVRIGSAITRYEIARRRPGGLAAPIAAGISRLLSELPAGSPVASLYAALSESSSPGDSLVARAHRAAREVAGDLVDAGAFLEAARAAAQAHDSAFFGGVRPPDAVRAALSAMKLARTPRNEVDWRRYEEGFATLLRRLPAS